MRALINIIFGKLDGNYEGSDGADPITLDTGATPTGWSGTAAPATTRWRWSAAAWRRSARCNIERDPPGTGTWTIG